MKKSELRELIRQALEELSTTSNVPGYNSKYAFKKKFDKDDYDYDYSGEQGTGKDRKTNKKPLKMKDIGDGMMLLRDMIKEDYSFDNPNVAELIRLFTKFPKDRNVKFMSNGKIHIGFKLAIDKDKTILIKLK